MKKVPKNGPCRARRGLRDPSVFQFETRHPRLAAGPKSPMPLEQ